MILNDNPRRIYDQSKCPEIRDRMTVIWISKEMTECLLAVDEQIGELYLKMEKAGMLEDTAVIIPADHGMTPSDNAIPLTALTYMNFPTAGVVIDGRNGYIWYGKEDRKEVIRFFENWPAHSRDFQS